MPLGSPNSWMTTTRMLVHRLQRPDNEALPTVLRGFTSPEPETTTQTHHLHRAEDG